MSKIEGSHFKTCKSSSFFILKYFLSLWTSTSFILIWSIYTIYVSGKQGPEGDILKLENGDEPIFLGPEINLH